MKMVSRIPWSYSEEALQKREGKDGAQIRLFIKQNGSYSQS